jgi:hypothetical protein
MIETRRAELASLCRRFYVLRLDVFGSAIRDDFNPARSDVDFLVEFDSPGDVGALRQFFGLKDALEVLLDRRGISL